MEDSGRYSVNFWSFTLSFYEQPGISALCLRLQNECNMDVMLLIAHCYGASIGIPLSEVEIKNLREHMIEWRMRSVLRLRALRIDLRQDVTHLPAEEREAFRQRLKQIELEAEKVQAGMIEEWFKNRDPHDCADFAQGLHVLVGDAGLSTDEVLLLYQTATAVRRQS